MIPLLLGIAVGAALTIYGEIAGRRRMVYVFKPLTTVLVLALAWVLPADPSSRYRAAIVIGLVCSLAGDIFLMLPGDRFIAGVVAFLLAHLAYLVAFTTEVPFAASPLAFLAVAIAVVAILVLLWSFLPRAMRLPLVVYALILGAMAAQAASQAVVLHLPAATAAAVGAVLFMASDTTLVSNRFARPFRMAPLVVLGTYYAAQTLIAASVTVTAP
jgi:uncharacterized membrane protein YhhN